MNNWHPDTTEQFHGPRDVVSYRFSRRRRGWVERLRNWLFGHVSDVRIFSALMAERGRLAAHFELEVLCDTYRVSDEQYIWACGLIDQRWPLTLPMSPDVVTFDVGMKVER